MELDGFITRRFKVSIVQARWITILKRALRLTREPNCQ